MKEKTPVADSFTTINDTKKYFEYIVNNVDWSLLDHHDIEKAIRKIDAGMSSLIRIAITENAWKPIEDK
jgi:hypothetical protein